MRDHLKRLVETGELDPEVDPAKIAPDVVFHPGCRIRGRETSIGPGCEIGREGPVTLEDCQLGSKVQLKGGYFAGATFLDGSSMGSGAHVRPGTLLEEEANGAHTVGLKQTILFPFVTLGSLINFCDIFMSGGTSRKDHSEVGSSYVHFNFTPHGDKATASLLGDVPQGVMLNKPPIFLGGQGGLVGPRNLAFGTVVAAGVVNRTDIEEENQLVTGGAIKEPLQVRPYRMGIYRGVSRLMKNNLRYIGNILALRAWYTSVRRPAMAADPFQAACCEGAIRQLDLIIEERLKRLQQVVDKMPESIAQSEHVAPDDSRKQLLERWPEIRSRLSTNLGEHGGEDRDPQLEVWSQADESRRYTAAIAALPEAVKQAGTRRLEAIVDSVTSVW
ncbi:MAG: UDP-N-acetylglucosamine pyrophosphorylase [Verrucomicrobiota bacterium]